MKNKKTQKTHNLRDEIVGILKDVDDFKHDYETATYYAVVRGFMLGFLCGRDSNTGGVKK